MNVYRLWSNRLLASLFQKLTKFFQIDVLMEIGAHDASASIEFLSGNIKSRRAFAFEANPYTFNEVTKLSQANGVEAFNLGITDSEQVKEMFIPMKNSSSSLTVGSSSFLRRNEESTSYSTCRVSTTTVDNFLNSKLIQEKVALWVDVEGYALPVIMGTIDAIARNQVQLIYLEVERHPYWSDQATYSEIKSRLNELGLFSIARDYEYRYQNNIIFVSGNLKRQTAPFVLFFYVLLGASAILSLPVVIFHKLSRILKSLSLCLIHP